MKEVPEDQLLMEHDIAIEELKTRLNSLENLVNQMHQYIPVWWDKQ